MAAAKRTQKPKGSTFASSSTTASAPFSRNLETIDLGGVIFGCTDSTIRECLTKQLFGLPQQHFAYVKNICPGLTLFLFNYSRRALHGIYEAVSCGQLNIDPYGWTTNGSQRTSYPAQVQIRVRKDCQPLVENQFKPVIKRNYYTHNHFWFELDHAQVSQLITLFSNQVAVAPSYSVHRNTGNWQIVVHRQPELKRREEEGSSTSHNHSNGHLSLTDPSSCLDEVNHSLGSVIEVMEKDETKRIYEKLQKLAVTCEPSDSSLTNQVQESAEAPKLHTEHDGSQKIKMIQDENANESPFSSDFLSVIAQLVQEVRELKAFKREQIQRNSQLEQKLIKSESEVQQLRDRYTSLESLSSYSEAYTYGTIMEPCSEQDLDPEDTVLLAGGYNGQSWLSSLDCYSPSKDIIKSLRPMSSVRSYASIAKLNAEVYVIGGGNNSSWYDTVECYNLENDNWTSLPRLNGQKGSLAAVTLHDKIFAIGGGNGVDCFSDVEMFDLDVGRWISGRSMLQKRFSLAAVELDGALYAVGGFDGKDYLRSAERFDPREHSWSRLESMNSQRGCHSLIVLNEKLFAIGGFDGNSMVPTVEVFDPRYGKWMIEAPMNHARGYSAAAVLSNTLYVIGGVEDSEKIVEKVEQYKEGHGWQLTNLKAVGKRCFAAAVAL